MTKLNALFNKLLNLVLLTVYWLVCSLPVFTAGAATAALYYTTLKVIKNDRGYVSGEFFRSFRGNFKVATACWLAHLAAGLLFTGEYVVCYRMWAGGEPLGWMWVLFLVLGILDATMAFFTMSYIARFEDKAGRTLKNSFLIMLRHLTKGLLQMLLLGVFVIAVVWFPPAVLIAPAAFMLLSSYTMEKIFCRYMSAKELAKEAERNRTHA